MGKRGKLKGGTIKAVVKPEKINCEYTFPYYNLDACYGCINYGKGPCWCTVENKI